MKNPTKGTMDATTKPRTMALIVDAEYFTGLRSLYGILEKDRVSITAKQNMVMLDLKPGLRTSPGKIPVKFVISDMTTAKLIINALLHSRPFKDMGLGFVS